MRLDTFFDNFELMADARNGVQKLREMILQLAVQGKLVPQEPKDEPASVLLQKMESKTKEPMKIGRGKIFDPMKPILDQEKVYPLPVGWEWVRLGRIIRVEGGSQPPKNTFIYESEEGYTRLIQIRDFKSDAFLTYIPNEKANRPFAEDDIMIGRYGPPVFQILRGLSGTYNVALMKAEPIDGVIIKDCLFYLLKEPRIQNHVIAESERTAGQSGVRKELIYSFVVGLPPEKEQKRIVAKIIELMAFCNELEARKQQVGINCIQLNDASIHKLLKTHEPKQFSQHWQRICDNFDLLYSKPENVNKLRQAILQLAVQGKLVPQDPKDEPASVLLKKIKAEKERLIKEKKIKKDKPLPHIDPDDILFSVPKGWAWTRLGNISTNIHYGYTASANNAIKDVRLLRITDIQNGLVNWKNVPGCEIDKAKIGQYALRSGDLLIARTGGTIGKTFLVEDAPVCAVFASYLIRVIPSRQIYPYYLKYFAISPLYWKQLYAKSSGTGQPNVNATSLKTLVTPLPPLREQKRIVAKVDELMALCDELEASLSKSQTDCDRLMEAAVAEIMAAEP